MVNSYCNSNHILVGLGGTGGKILRSFKMRMFEEFPEQEERNKQSVALLYVDSTDEMMPKDGRPRTDFRVMGLDASFTNNEFLNIKAIDVAHLLDNINNYPSVKGIVNNASSVKSAIGSLGVAAGQKRRAGRLLFAANAKGYENALRDAYARCVTASGNESELTIHIFAGLCGGTGSGSIIDAIVQARKLFPNSIIAVYAMIPEMNLPKASIDQGRYYQNGYAAINELNALQTGRFIPHDVTGNGEKADLYNGRVKGVANGITLYSNVNENGQSLNSFEELPKTVSDYVYARIFLINSEDKVNEDIIRAYNFENMDDFALEYDELSNGISGKLEIARTKKVNSFGIKRVMYPELRILKHITYTIGESVLYQFKYNNWREEQGYVNEEANKDYREIYLNEQNLANWMLDDRHLTLENKILPSDKDWTTFLDYWDDKAHGYANDPVVKKAACPLNELDSLLSDFFSGQFRTMGVETYFKEKAKAIPEMSAEIRRKIEHELFDKWRNGDVSIVELQKVSGLLLEKVASIREHIEENILKTAEEIEAINDDCKANVREWSELNVFQRIAQVGNRIYARHQNDLADLYTERTRALGLQFAKALAAKVQLALQNMDADITTFGQVINAAIEETERLISSQRKVNKGLEDMKGAIIEVSEDDAMSEFEVELKLDKTDMPNIAHQIREQILPASKFTNFGRLANEISIDDIRDAFDLKLSEVVRAKHNEKSESDKKVLGLNILTQLQQKLPTDDDIKSFAYKIVQQAGVYLILNNDEMQLHVRNNEGNLSPTNPASINKKTILVSIPSPEKDESLKRFANKLETAFKQSFRQGTAITDVVFNTSSPRKNELSIITVSYCFPMRCVEWLKTYRDKYNRFLQTGNSMTDANNAILLHSEEDGKGLPSIFVVEQKEETQSQPMQMQNSQTPATSTVPPVILGTPVPPPIQKPEPNIQLYLAINGQQYGPFNYAQCKQMVQTGQLTTQTLVWHQALSNWTVAIQVAELKELFAPVAPMPTGMPPMPPIQ